jgi:hypothetical protein
MKYICTSFRKGKNCATSEIVAAYKNLQRAYVRMDQMYANVVVEAQGALGIYDNHLRSNTNRSEDVG